MTREEFVSQLSEEYGISKRVMRSLVNDVFHKVAEVLETDGSFTQQGFGTLKVVHRAERRAFNIQTMEPMTVPAHYTVTFKASNALKDRVNQ